MDLLISRFITVVSEKNCCKVSGKMLQFISIGIVAKNKHIYARLDINISTK